MPINKRIKHIFERFQEHNHTPVTELYYTNHFTLLIAVVMSARMTDKGVNKVTQILFQQIHTPQDVINLGLEELTDAMRSIGLYKTKARHIYELSHILQDQYHGQIPSHREELEALPGVGRKTANVVLNVAFDEPVMPVDTHVFRLSHRLGLSQGKTPSAVEKDLLSIIPKKFLAHAHHWLILHGRYICTSQSPKCQQCFQNDLCPYYNNLQKQK